VAFVFTSTTTTMSLIERARASGRCPPSLLQEETSDGANGFEAAVTQILDANGTSIVRFMCCNNSLRTSFKCSSPFFFSILLLSKTCLYRQTRTWWMISSLYCRYVFAGDTDLLVVDLSWKPSRFVISRTVKERRSVFVLLHCARA
jgi:hypothetical protein